MDELTIKCASCESDKLFAYEIGGDKNWIQVDVFQAHREASVNLDKTSARQLHEWLGRYLENSDG